MLDKICGYTITPAMLTHELALIEADLANARRHRVTDSLSEWITVLERRRDELKERLEAEDGVADQALG